MPPPVHVQPPMLDELATAIQRFTDPRATGKPDPDSPWFGLGHAVGTLMERLQATQEELAELRRSYDHLLDRLYPSNEIYVVARA